MLDKLKLYPSEQNDDNIIYFDSDEDFYKFCVVPELITIECDIDGVKHYYYDFDFSYLYKDAIKQGKHFIIKDENSSIFKNKTISYRTITKPIQNLYQYFDI